MITHSTLSDSDTFRIVSVDASSYGQPFMVEEQTSVWYLPWPRWQKLKQLNQDTSNAQLYACFQTVGEARTFIDNIKMQRAQQERKRRNALLSQRPEIFPRVVGPISAAA